MICANCGTQNELGTRFCDECGAALSAACPTCGATNRPTAKFCATCGTALGGQATASAGQPAVAAQAERRLVSVLFADLVGSTAFADERDPEQVRELLERYFAICRLAIERHGGTVEKFIGDAVMAVWGTPTAHEDDAERAVRAALELLDAVHSLDLGVDARAAVMTGEAAVNLAAIGQGMVAGDLVNTASRLQSVAPPGSVLVGEATMRASQAAISFERVGDQELKGKSAPVPAFRATRVVANRGGQSRSEAIEAPFVGREEELRQLKDLLHTSSRDPRVRLVSITGPAGIGKSRLTWEFEKYVDGLVETIYWHRGRSPAYGEGITFWALGEMVRRRAELSEADDEPTTRVRIAATVAEFIPDADERSWVEHALLTLLGVEPAPASGSDALFAAWRVFFERIAARGTTALVFEDLQWADNGLLDFIEHVLEWSKHLPLLVITLSRPELVERRPGWGSGHRFMTALTLEPLSDLDMRKLLTGLAPGLPPATVDAILARADGIPLYAVEIVRMLVADGKLAAVDGVYQPTGELGDLAVPETLRSLIASRLDALDPGDRTLLQDASVLGQRFTLPALVAVTGTPADQLEPRLRSLARREFLDVEVDPRSPERGQYGFVQSLIREVAYGTLARRDRRSRHLAAARYYEALGDDELAGVLATHYLAAHEASSEGPERDAIGVQARRSLRSAGERAATLGAHAQAVTFFTQALAVTTEPLDRAALLVLIADSANPSAQDELAEASAREAISIFRAGGEEASAVRAAALLGRVMIDAGRLHDASQELESALAGRASDGDDEASAAVLAVLARIYMRLSENERAVAAADRALAAAERARSRPIMAEALLNKGSSLTGLGRPVEGRVLLQSAVDLAGEIGDYDIQLRGLNNLASNFFDDDPRRALGTVEESLDLAQRMGQASIWNWQVGAAAMYQLSIGDNWSEPQQLLEEVLARAETPHDRARALAHLALYRVAQGNRGRAALDEARSASSTVDEVQMLSAIDWAEALLAHQEGNYSTAIAKANSAVALWNNFATEVLPIAGRAAASAGHRKEFDEIAGRIESERRTGALVDADRLWARAMAKALDGNQNEAAQLFTSAGQSLEHAGFHYYAAEIYLDAVSLLPSQPGAAEWASTARAIFERLDARPYLDLLDEAEAKIEKPRQTSQARPGTAIEPVVRHR